jgi:hypothetical protein
MRRNARIAFDGTGKPVLALSFKHLRFLRLLAASPWAFSGGAQTCS